jgi:hypothetical protein
VKLGLPTLKAEHRQMVFENIMPQKIFGPKREKAISRLLGWRRRHSEQVPLTQCHLPRKRYSAHIHKARWAKTKHKSLS